MKTFTQKVYDVVKKIPKGYALTYKEVARRAGKPDAQRAVGTILSKNYNPKIPCHRVLRSDGGLGGYNRGLAQKRALLTKEGFLKTGGSKGFTLVEILVTVAILVILSLIIYANVNEARKKARDAVRIRDAQVIAKAIDSYYVENNKFPISTYAYSSKQPEWNNFLNAIGIENDLVPPLVGQNLEGVTNIPIEDFDMVQRYNYSFMITWGSDIPGLNPPRIYVPLETPGIPCVDDNDPEGCTPECNVAEVTGFLGATNCGDLKRGCRPATPSIGGANRAICIPVGPNAP